MNFWSIFKGLDVENGEITGAVGTIGRHGKVAYLESSGMMDVDAGKPMQQIQF